MKTLRVPDAIGWVLLFLVVTFGLALVVTPSSQPSVAHGERTATP